MSYDNQYNEWKKNPERYWDDKASLIDWYEKYQNVLSKDNSNNFIWFKGAYKKWIGKKKCHHL